MKRSYQQWQKETSAVRSQHFLRAVESFRSKIQNAPSELSALLADEIGTAVEVPQAESLPTSLVLLDHFLEDFRQHLGRPLLPVGHSALFLGWNDPLVQFCRRVPAIMSAGGGVVEKPSRRASQTVLRVGELWSQALSESQVSAGLFAVLTGGHEGADSVGALLLEHPGFKTVFWVGETDTGIDQLVHLACALMGTKIGLVAVIGDTDLLFRSIVGLENASVPADISVTRKMVEMGTGAILDVPNAASDPRFADHPWVTGPQAVRSYAGATISNSVGVPIGSIAVMDTKRESRSQPRNEHPSLASPDWRVRFMTKLRTAVTSESS